MVEPPDWSALFAFNPADPDGSYNPLLNLRLFSLYIDLPCYLLMVGSVCAFWLASGTCRALVVVAAPVIILMGIFWSIQCFVFMLSALNLDTFGMGYVIAMNTTLYGFIAAAGFLIVDMLLMLLRGSNAPPSLPLVEGTEQAKDIVDWAVENV